MTKLPIAALCLLGLAAAPALAQTTGKSNPATSTTTRAQVQAQLKEVFAKADTDKDGFMSRAEFAARMTGILNRTPPGTKGAPSKEEAQRIIAAAQAAFNAADTNKDGKLSPAEAGKRTLAMFDNADTNHDGILTPAEKAAVRNGLNAGAKAPATR